MTLLRDAARRGDARENFVARAVEILSFYAELAPDDLARARKAEVWAAAALHAAPFTMFPGHANPDRPTLEDAARCFGVSSQSVSVRSRPLRDSWYALLDLGEHPRLPGASAGIARLVTSLGGVEVTVFAETVPGGALAGLFDTATTALGDGTTLPGDVAFDLEGFARERGLGGPDLLALREAAARGADAYCRERLGRPREGHPWSEILEQSVGFGYFLREALRGGGASHEARDALAWYVVGLLAGDMLGRAAPAPAFPLLAVAHLAGRGALGGQPLRTALELAVRDRAPLDGITTEELGPLWRAVGSDVTAPADVRAEALSLLVASAGFGTGAQRGIDLVSALALDDGLPLDVRRAALREIADAEARYVPFGRITPGVRRYALRHLAELEERPWRAAVDMADEAGRLEDPVMSRAAAEVLERHGSSAPEETVQALVERGMGAPDASARQAWYRAGIRLLGGDVREWAPPDVLARAERSTRAPDDSAQTSLF